MKVSWLCSTSVVMSVCLVAMAFSLMMSLVVLYRQQSSVHLSHLPDAASARKGSQYKENAAM